MNKRLAAVGIVAAALIGLVAGRVTAKRSEAAEQPAPAAVALPTPAQQEPVAVAPPSPPAPRPEDMLYDVPVSARDPQLGPDDALVTRVVYGDFECPFCTRIQPTLSALREHYGAGLRVVWKNNPMHFHPQSVPAALLAQAAFIKGGNDTFWKAHDLLLQNQSALGRADLERYGAQLGLDKKAVARALDDKAVRAKVDEDQEIVKRLMLQATPSFFINGRYLRGAQPQRAFERLIDEELAKAEAKLKSGVAKADLYRALTRGGRTEAIGSGGVATNP